VGCRENSVGMTTRTKIFFMHIAKTAGSYVNDIFTRSLGPEKCFVHCEEKMQDVSVFREALADKLFVSGHIYYHDWLRLSRELNYEFVKITMVRNPSKHLKSHLLYLSNWDLPKLKGGFKVQENNMNQIIRELSFVDFANPLSISKFMDTLSPVGIELFNNCQSRYFLSTKLRDPHMPLNMNHERLLLSILPQFDLIGLNENSTFFLTEVERLSGIKLTIHDELINKTVSGSDIDLDNEVIRKVFKRNSEVDEVLYTAVLQQTTQALSARVAELEGGAATANARASKAERQVSELRSQLSSSDDQLHQSAAELDILRTKLAHLNAERDAAARSLPWRIARKIGRIGIRTSRRAT
jgi:hypothetical protein